MSVVLQEIKIKYAESEECESVEELFGYLVFEKGGLHKAIDFIAKQYAEKCVVASLEKASEKGVAYKLALLNNKSKAVVEKKSIANSENIVLL